MRKEICTLINWDQHIKCERISHPGQKLEPAYTLEEEKQTSGAAWSGQTPPFPSDTSKVQGQQGRGGTSKSLSQEKFVQQLGGKRGVPKWVVPGGWAIRGAWGESVTMHANSLCVLSQNHTHTQTATHKPRPAACSWAQDRTGWGEHSSYTAGTPLMGEIVREHCETLI